jgi:hypothetical protein
MSFQGVVSPRETLDVLLEIEGANLVGTKIKAPFAIHPEVYVLPMENVLATKARISQTFFAQISEYRVNRERAW